MFSPSPNLHPYEIEFGSNIQVLRERWEFSSFFPGGRRYRPPSIGVSDACACKGILVEAAQA